MVADFAKWEEILKEAVQRGVQERRGPIPGARLRELVAQIAKEKGLEYPPASTPTLKFGQFLEQHPGVVAVRRRPEADVLVAPTDRPELLVETPTPHASLPGVRSDLFYAFTRILPEGQAWYDKTNDKVVWQRKDVSMPSDQFVKIPDLSIEDARATRMAFAGEQSDLEKKAMLERAASNPSGLGAFTEAVRNTELRAEWHQFRVRALVDRIGTWAKEVGIQWQDSWLTTSSRGEPSLAAPLEVVRDWKFEFESLIRGLDQRDLSRVMVPLDIVLKALQRRR